MKRKMGKLNIVRRVKKDSLPSLTTVIESLF